MPSDFDHRVSLIQLDLQSVLFAPLQI